MPTIDIQQAYGDGWIVLVNGFQWGDDRDLFDHSLGCSGQVFNSTEAIYAALHKAGISW